MDGEISGSAYAERAYDQQEIDTALARTRSALRKLVAQVREDWPAPSAGVAVISLSPDHFAHPITVDDRLCEVLDLPAVALTGTALTSFTDPADTPRLLRDLELLGADPEARVELDVSLRAREHDHRRIRLSGQSVASAPDGPRLAVLHVTALPSAA